MSTEFEMDDVARSIVASLDEEESGRVTTFLRSALGPGKITDLEEWRIALDKIAFRAHVGKTLHADYGPNWDEKKNDGGPLPDAWWLAAALAFIKAGVELKNSENLYGYALKAANAAYATIDLCHSSADKELRPMLEEQIGKIIDTVISR